MKSQRSDIHISIERHVSLIVCFSLFLILIFGSVSASSYAYADDMMGMPSPQDAPATTDALTAGGGPDNSDDDENDDDSGGSQDSDDDNDNDKDKDNDKDDEPIPKDAPATADTLTAKKLECPEGQEVTLFSTTCKPADGGSDSTQGTTSAATVCPTSATPTSYSTHDESSVTKAVWSSNNNDYEIKTEERDAQQAILHRVATPESPGATNKGLISNPSLLAICTGKPVSITSPNGDETTHDPDGTVTVKKPDGTETTNNPDGTKYIKKSDASGVATVDSYNADNKLTSSSKLDPDTGIKVKTIEYDPDTRVIASETTFSPVDGKPVLKKESDFIGNMITTTQYYPGTDKPHKVLEIIYDKGKGGEQREITTEYTADGGRTIRDLSSNGGTENTYDRAGTLVKTKALDEDGHQALDKDGNPITTR